MYEVPFELFILKWLSFMLCEFHFNKLLFFQVSRWSNVQPGLKTSNITFLVHVWAAKAIFPHLFFKEKHSTKSFKPFPNQQNVNNNIQLSVFYEFTIILFLLFNTFGNMKKQVIQPKSLRKFRCHCYTC